MADSMLAAELGGKKDGLPMVLTGPLCTTHLLDIEATRKERYCPIDGTYRV